MRHYTKTAHYVFLMDGDEALKWVREKEFGESQCYWIAGISPRTCARWCVKMIENTAHQAGYDEYSAAELEALRVNPYRQTRPLI